MKVRSLILYALPIMAASLGCSGSAGPGQNEQVDERKKGDVLFWQDGKPAYGLTTVMIKEETKEVTRDIINGSPTCLTPGCACFTLPPGIYEYTAKEAFPGTATWTGTVTVVKDSCLSVELH